MVTEEQDLPNRWAYRTGLVALGEAAEALDLYRQARAATDDPQITMSSAYATATLYARHLPPGDQDPAQARRWLELVLRQWALSGVFYEQGISREGHPEHALSAIDDGLARLAYYNRATLRSERGGPRSARADLEQVITLQPAHTEARVALCDLRLACGDAVAVEEFARAGLVPAPDDPDLLCILGLACAERKRPVEAEELLSQAVAGNPQLAEAWTNRAAVRFERGDTAGALADLDRGGAVV